MYVIFGEDGEPVAAFSVLGLAAQWLFDRFPSLAHAWRTTKHPTSAPTEYILCWLRDLSPLPIKFTRLIEIITKALDYPSVN